MGDKEAANPQSWRFAWISDHSLVLSAFSGSFGMCSNPQVLQQCV